MRKQKTFTKTYEKVCSLESCKKPFTTVYSFQKFCTPECGLKNNLNRANATAKSHRIKKEKEEPRHYSYPSYYIKPEPIERTCLWCHAKFKAVRSKTQIFCCHECNYEYRKMRERIYAKYPFEHAKVNAEFERLRILGNQYVLEAIS